jgi:iron complex outermembrane receptor protein
MAFAIRSFSRSYLLSFVFCCALLASGGGKGQVLDQSTMEHMFGEPVTSSATGQPQRASDVPADMEIITADDIRRSGADNIPDILQFVAGLDVRRYGFAAADVGVRGYNETSNPRLLVLLDGQQVYLDDLGRTQWYTLPVELEEIRQIEIIKGPNTALFGFNAASGVINIITYNPLHDSVNAVTARAGTQDYGALTAIGTARLGDAGGIRIALGGFRANEFAPTGVVPDDMPFRMSPTRRSATVNMHARIAPDIEMYAFGGTVETRIWEATASPYYGTDFQRTNWLRLGMTADTAVGLLSLSAYRNELRYTFDGATEREDLHDTVYVVQINDLFKIGASHVLRLGLDYRANNARSSDILPGRVGYEVLSGDIMWNWRITPTLSLTGAIRYDHLWLNQAGLILPDTGLSASVYNDRELDQVSFNAGLVWNATETDTLRLLLGRGLQLPSIYDLFLQDREVYGGQNYLYVGQPGLRAAAVSNVELLWDRQIPPLRSRLRVALFAQRTTNIITNPYETATLPNGIVANGFPELMASAENVGDSSAFGGEIGLRGQSPTGWRWNVSYSFISISDHLSINQDGIFSPQDFHHGTPVHALVVGLGYTRDKWEFDVWGRWQSRFLDFRADPNQNTLQPFAVGNYLTLNAHALYRITEHLNLGVTAQQFNNSHLLLAAAPAVERRVFVTIAVRF